jgi:hypothetical protein
MLEASCSDGWCPVVAGASRSGSCSRPCRRGRGGWCPGVGEGFPVEPLSPNLLVTCFNRNVQVWRACCPRRCVARGIRRRALLVPGSRSSLAWSCTRPTFCSGRSGTLSRGLHRGCRRRHPDPHVLKEYEVVVLTFHCGSAARCKSGTAKPRGARAGRSQTSRTRGSSVGSTPARVVLEGLAKRLDNATAEAGSLERDARLSLKAPIGRLKSGQPHGSRPVSGPGSLGLERETGPLHG